MIVRDLAEANRRDRDDGHVPRKLYQSKGGGPGKGGQGKKPGKDKGQSKDNKGRGNSDRY